MGEGGSSARSLSAGIVFPGSPSGPLKGSRGFGPGPLSQGVWWKGALGGLCPIPQPPLPGMARRVAGALVSPPCLGRDGCADITALPSTVAEAFPPISRVTMSREGHPLPLPCPALGDRGASGHPRRDSPQPHIGRPCQFFPPGPLPWLPQTTRPSKPGLGLPVTGDKP